MAGPGNHRTEGQSTGQGPARLRAERRHRHAAADVMQKLNSGQAVDPKLVYFRTVASVSIASSDASTGTSPAAPETPGAHRRRSKWLDADSIGGENRRATSCTQRLGSRQTARAACGWDST